jgi:hypothetical protein
MEKPSPYPQCNGKNRYTRHGAEQAKVRVGIRRGKDMRIYECPLCRGWHLTKKKRDYFDKDTDSVYEALEAKRKVR